MASTSRTDTDVRVFARVWPALSATLPTPSDTENPLVVFQAPRSGRNPSRSRRVRSKSSRAAKTCAATDTFALFVDDAPKLSVIVRVTG